MGKYIKVFKTHTEYNTYAQSGDIVKPNVSYCKDNKDVHYNPWTYAEAYLTFVALEDGTFQLSRNAVSYSLDNGETWTSLAANTASPTVTAGNKIMWKATLTPQTNAGIGTFSATGNFNVQGNVMSLLYGDNFKGQTDLTGKNYAFCKLFYQNAKVVNADNLSLPATTLANSCYSSMFIGCTSLVTAPVLSATTLASSCYYSMFSGCTSLTTAPQLPATTLATECYRNMFRGCTSLNYIKAMFTTTPSSTYTSNWVSGVAASGTFVKNSAAEWDVTGVNGVPTGWTVEKYIPTESSLIMYIDDFPEDKDYDEGSVQDRMIAEIENPIEKGANPYGYFGETIVYNGNTYYLWQAINGFQVDNEHSKYFATTTVDFNTLYSQSLEDDLNNHFTSAIGMFNDSKSIYMEQGELPDGSDIHYLVKVENLE